ncbi:MAG: hypothetical protein IRD7MM_00440 [Candidatus Midichloria mitochondrii]
MGRGYVPNIILISTILATFIGAGSILGVAEKVYKFGIFYMIPFLCMPFFWLVTAQIYGKNIKQFRGCMSVSDMQKLKAEHLLCRKIRQFMKELRK